ncbi:SDR family NAD(P)-dependent oxidoreductase [Marinilongibacter aquaticus]|uniref:SDR family oxidoreductase n=1 Tax=Marinilongibacter aquaticus TaxID=2975157 RepID=UPI0021BDDBCB|nr:SDR family NAD(P)-dependent oxidoreductase [Marinilongibacter aquaticus]UBM59663.1 SDR family NAD(P)-dependent oxidoreductase [Marinilongibacter aquaticus]
MKLQGNTILITGGSSGIGLALAKQFLQLGNSVILTGRNAKKLEAIQKQYPAMHCLICELTEEESLKKLVNRIEADFQDLNILINNAGVQYNYLFSELPYSSPKIDQEIETNLNAPIKLTHMLLPLLQKKNEAAIVNVSSGLYITPKQSASVYCATKAALHSFSQSLRFQLKNTAIRVFELIPELVDTPMTAGRGKAKMSADTLTEHFLKAFEKNRFEIYIGKTKLLKLIHRLSPQWAQKIMINQK